MDTRHNQLVLLSKKVETANNKINEIISRLGWTRSELTQWQEKQDLTKPKKSISAKIPTKTSSLFFYQNSSSVISFIEPIETNSNKLIVDDINKINHQQKDLDKSQAYDQIIHRSNQLRQLAYHHRNHENKQTSKLDEIVYQDQQKKKKKRQQQESNEQQQDKRKQI
ncbi:hypothetical protein INT46_011560 [Mucor plumbeus]|uniref:Uncharacterized protein n=1 Tax=Mucor plumbeus TaxID=97098 RepID=A0A8H7RHS8_9FUNG|nr:hypothetical protein INT46_011560 [Mucor plumbeus]